MVTMVMFVVTVGLACCEGSLVQVQLCHLAQKATRASRRLFTFQKATTILTLFLSSDGNATTRYHMANQLQK
jgi:hypothetical protein